MSGYDLWVSFFTFPNPVNEKAARTVATVVAVTSAVTVLTGWWWLLVPLALGLGWTAAAAVLMGVLTVFATLEAALGWCAGCWAFGHLMRLGVIPEETCAACNDIRLRATA